MLYLSAYEKAAGSVAGDPMTVFDAAFTAIS